MLTRRGNDAFEVIHLSPRDILEVIVLPELNREGLAFVLGEVADGPPINVAFDRDTGLSAVRKIATAAGLSFAIAQTPDGPLEITLTRTQKAFP